jgi:hypothetical protein
MLRHTDWRALQWIEDDASEPVQLEFSFSKFARESIAARYYPKTKPMRSASLPQIHGIGETNVLSKHFKIRIGGPLGVYVSYDEPIIWWTGPKIARLQIVFRLQD